MKKETKNRRFIVSFYNADSFSHRTFSYGRKFAFDRGYRNDRSYRNYALRTPKGSLVIWYTNKKKQMVQPR